MQFRRQSRLHWNFHVSQCCKVRLSQNAYNQAQQISPEHCPSNFFICIPHGTFDNTPINELSCVHWKNAYRQNAKINSFTHQTEGIWIILCQINNIVMVANGAEHVWNRLLPNPSPIFYDPWNHLGWFCNNLCWFEEEILPIPWHLNTWSAVSDNFERYKR